MLSIIIPCYNAEATVERSIHSILDQSYKDIEVVVVDDFSTDSSAALVENISASDCRVRLIRHNENKGVGMARRTGIEHMSGEYMCFCDADDYLKKDCLERMMSAMTNHDVDIVAAGLIIADKDGNVVDERIPTYEVQEGKLKYKPNPQDTKRFFPTMLLKSSLWDNLEYSPRRYLEDTTTIMRVLYYARRVLMLDYAGYVYVQNPTSLIHTADESKNAVYRALGMMDLWLFFKDKYNSLSSPDAFLSMYRRAKKMLEQDKRASLIYEGEMKEMRLCIKRINN